MYNQIRVNNAPQGAQPGKNMNKPQAYRLKTQESGYPAGSIFYKQIVCDYGLANDDTRTTGVEHVTVTLKSDGGYPGFTVPKHALEPIDGSPELAKALHAIAGLPAPKPQPGLQLKVKRLHPDAVLPEYATDGAACFDLHAITSGENRFVPMGGNNEFRTGLAFEVPAGHVMLIFSRSGHGFKNDTRLSNCVGVIDADYRGEVMVKLANDTHRHATNGYAALHVNNGDRIAQAMLVPIPRVALVEVDELSATARGDGGFGSTGNG